MNKVTVVMPTLLKPDKSIYEYTIKELCNNNNVEKVVILLNNKDKIIELLHPKLKVIDDKENLYVNPAWNYGLSICNTEYYLIINDDVFQCMLSVDVLCLDVRVHGFLYLKN